VFFKIVKRERRCSQKNDFNYLLDCKKRKEIINMRNLTLKCTILGFFLGMCIPMASGMVVEFSEVDLPGLTPLDGTNHFDAYGLAFEDTTYYCVDFRLPPAGVDDRGITTTSGPDNLMTIIFITPASYSIVDWASIYGNDIYATAYDSDGNVLDSQSATGLSGTSYGTFVFTGLGPIAKITLHDGTGMIAVGRLEFETLLVEVEKTVDPNEIGLADSGLIPENTTVTLTVTGYGGTIQDTIPIDVVYGIDSSGSMGWNDPGDLRLDAAKDFTDKLDSTRDQAGVVSWDGGIDFTYGLTSDFVTLKNQIDNVNSSGGTNLNVGLNACIAMLDANPRTGNSSEVIIFLSNGAGTYTYAGSGGPASNAASKGYVIYSIGLGSSPATGPLTDMATATGGQYYPSPTADNLQAIFDAIFTQVIISTAPSNVDVLEVTQDYIVEEGNFSIAPDAIVDISGKTKMVWLNVAQYVGNNDDHLAADETFTVTFTAKSSQCGILLPVDVEGLAVVNYVDPDNNTQSVPIPQAYITVRCPIAVDIKPTSCPNPLNVQSNGVLPVAIVGTESLDVTQVDPGTIMLVGVGPLRCNYEDVVTPYYPLIGKETQFYCTEEGPDGYLDLTLKFDKQEVVEAIGEVNDGDVIVLTLTGNLLEEHGGTPIIGEDIIIIRKKGRK
jgi:hypothetical protein